MLSPKTMELERVSGVNTENPMHGYQIKSVHSDSWLIYAHLLAGGLGRWFAHFIFAQNWLHKPPPVWTCTIARPFQVFHPHRCQKFHYVISSYIRSHPWATAVLEAEPCSQEASSISKFKISVWHSSLARSTGALPEDCWHPNWHPWITSIHTWTILIWSTCALPTLTSVSHSALAHGYPRRVPSANVKDKDELRNYLCELSASQLTLEHMQYVPVTFSGPKPILAQGHKGLP